MPWADIIIVAIIAAAALIGYNVGLLGAFKGFIGSIVGMVTAWLLTPIAQAWLESKWAVSSFLADIIGEKLPESMVTLIQGAAKTAATLQEFRESLLAKVPPEMASYMQRTLDKATMKTVPSPDMAIQVVTREIAQGLIWTFFFILIWLIVSILVKSFLSMIFIRKDGKSIIGVFDGILGLTAMMVIVVVSLVVFSGLLYPLAFMADTGSGFARIYPYLLDSRLMNWMASIYQLYVIPWVA